MRIAIRWLCLSTLTLGAFACGSEPAAPCSAKDAAAGLCQPKAAEPVELPPGTILPDWALHLCKDWTRPDGSCEQGQIMADYQECLSQSGLPEQQRLAARGVGNRGQQRAMQRATHTCLELRRWVMSAEAQQRWVGKPVRRPAPPPS